MNELTDLYQQVIIDHGRCPRNFGCLENADAIKEGFNPLCGDKLTLYLQVREGVVNKASFEGKGCAISVASASLMTEALIGLSLSQIEILFNDFHQLLTQADAPIDSSRLGKLIAFEGVKAFPMRVKCATLAWHTLLAAVQQQQDVMNPIKEVDHV